MTTEYHCGMCGRTITQGSLCSGCQAKKARERIDAQRTPEDKLKVIQQELDSVTAQRDALEAQIAAEAAIKDAEEVLPPPMDPSGLPAKKLEAADRVIETLKRDPELLEAVKIRLHVAEGTTFVCYVLLMVEHEFGQRDEGWTLYRTKEAAEAAKEKEEGPGAPGQYFSYEGPTPFEVEYPVWARLGYSGPLHSKSNHLPNRGTVITMDMLR